MPPYQKRVLQTLAKDPSESVFAADYIRKHDLKTGAHLAKALEQLQSKGIVEKENKQYTISDVFFKEWLKL
ncbi:MAG: hypothetical protein AOA65_1860 [Candidatus Bathyarchaeota archaeon BA1]|nr:MAG: hypothetical protein AOA65_1860 [Candidatus Bathyarchaeota archaeon BA1]